jgi:hypothetical protein
MLWAGSHLHWAIWCWPLYDVVWRGVALVFLPRWECIRMGIIANVTLNTVSTENDGPSLEVEGLNEAIQSSTGPNQLGDDISFVARILDRLRDFVGSDSWILGANSMDVFFQEPRHSGVHHRWCAIIACCICVGIVLLVTYYTHIRKVRAARLRIRLERIPPPDPLRFEEVEGKVKTEDQHELYYWAESSLIPTVTWMCVWSIGYATCFAWVRAVPILLRTVYPVMATILVVYLVFLPG